MHPLIALSRLFKESNVHHLDHVRCETQSRAGTECVDARS